MVQFHDFINLLIKPTDACNLRCKYCFHKFGGYDNSVMTLDMVKHIYDIVFPHYKSVSILWHGGEPLCAGYDFYYNALAMQKEYQERYEVSIRNSMQTNSTLLTQEFIDLFKLYDLKIGISYDGIVNDYTRASTNAVNEKRLLLNSNGFDPGIITVVSGININRLIDNYEVMKAEKRNIQLNHYIEMDKAHPDLEMALDLDDYVNKMYEFFLYWISDKDCNIEVQPFISYALELLFNVLSVCSRTSCMRSWLCIEHNGDIAPCDKHMPAEYSYGNILNYSDIRQVYESSGFRNLLLASIARREKCMNLCELYKYCEGGCNHAAYIEGDISSNGGFSCQAYKKLYIKIKAFFEENDITSLNYFNKLVNPNLVKTLKKYEEHKI